MSKNTLPRRGFLATINHELGGERRVMDLDPGFPAIERFSMNAPELNLDEIPETVAKDILRPAACALANIVKGLNALPRERIGENPFA